MAVIIDNDVVHEVFSNKPSFINLRDWLFGKNYAKMAYGGKLKTEILKHRKYKKSLTELERAGKIDDVPYADIRAEKISFDCDSNDQDIIAIIRLKGIRLVSTKDKQLKSDLRKKRLTIPVRKRCTRPTCTAECRVKIYNEKEGHDLLSKYGRCEYKKG